MVQTSPGYIIYFALVVSRHMQSNNAERFDISDCIDYMQKLCSKYQSEVDLAPSSILSTTWTKDLAKMLFIKLSPNANKLPLMSVGIIHLNRESSLTSKFSFLECDRCYHCTTGFFPSPTLLRVCRKHSFKVNVISSFITIAVKLYIFFPGVWALFNAWTICFYLFGFMKCRTMWPRLLRPLLPRQTEKQ